LFWNFMVIPCFVLNCLFIENFLLFFTHMEPFNTHVSHNFLWRPVRM
jgi:hypothetical protein